MTEDEIDSLVREFTRAVNTGLVLLWQDAAGSWRQIGAIAKPPDESSRIAIIEGGREYVALYNASLADFAVARKLGRPQVQAFIRSVME